MGDDMRELLDQLHRTLSGRAGRPTTDDFKTHQIRARLSRLTTEMQHMVQQTTPQFALGHHARAVSLAYDKTLLEACELAGVPLPEDDGGGPATRLLAEASLLQAGWRW